MASDGRPSRTTSARLAMSSMLTSWWTRTGGRAAAAPSSSRRRARRRKPFSFLTNPSSWAVRSRCGQIRTGRSRRSRSRSSWREVRARLVCMGCGGRCKCRASRGKGGGGDGDGERRRWRRRRRTAVGRLTTQQAAARRSLMTARALVRGVSGSKMLLWG